jgi:hypothetical protein
MKNSLLAIGLAAAVQGLCGAALAQPQRPRPPVLNAMPLCGVDRAAVLRAGYRPSAVPCCGATMACGQFLTTVSPLARPKMRG